MLGRVLRDLEIRRKRRLAFQPRHDDPRCYSPAVERHLRRVGILPQADEVPHERRRTPAEQPRVGEI
jgi:hypothetical protein